MVSIIQSNYRGMGSGLMPDGLGFMFQNRGELFALQDGHPGQAAAHLQQALTIYQRIGAPGAERVQETLRSPKPAGKRRTT